MDIKANYGAPALDASTSIDQVKQITGLGQVREHLPDRPARVVLGLGFPGFLNNVKKSGKWKPANNKIFIVEGDSVYSQTISKFAQQQAPKDGWRRSAGASRRSRAEPPTGRAVLGRLLLGELRDGLHRRRSRPRR